MPRVTGLFECLLEKAILGQAPSESAKRIWKRSWIYEEAHIQVCVRNQQNILAVWHVGPDGRYGKHAG
jgi:hypothetical protein